MDSSSLALAGFKNPFVGGKTRGLLKRINDGVTIVIEQDTLGKLAGNCKVSLLTGKTIIVKECK